jgi:hypothetical protein
VKFTTATFITILAAVTLFGWSVASRARDVERDVINLQKQIAALELRVEKLKAHQITNREGAIRREVEVSNIKDDIRVMKGDLRTLLNLVRDSKGKHTGP